MSTEATGKGGVVSQLKDSMGGSIKKLLSLPDKPNHPAARKAARIVADILIMLLAAGLMFMMLHGNFAALANPPLTTFMVLPMGCGIMGVGLSWLIQDILGKKHQRTAAKIAAIITPIGLVAGLACLAGAGFHSGLVGPSFNLYLLSSLLIVPLAFYAVDRAQKLFTRNELPLIVRRAAPKIYNEDVDAAKRRSRYQNTKRVNSSRKQTSSRYLDGRDHNKQNTFHFRHKNKKQEYDVLKQPFYDKDL